MDLLEHTSFSQDIIVLQTVLEEVRHRSLPLFNRLQALIGEEDRRIWLFYNEARSDTFAGRRDGETPNDRNDRAIREAAAWYKKHLRSIKFVLMSDDAGNRREAEALGLDARSTKQYVASMPDDRAVVLSDLVAEVGQGFETSGHESSLVKQPKTTYAPEYLATSTLQAGMASGALHQGYFNLDPYNYREGTVKVHSYPKPILLVGSENMNRSVTGDSVVVQLLPESEWRAPADEVLDEETEAVLDDNPDEDDEGAMEAEVERRLLLETKKKAQVASKERQPTGRVVGVIKRGWRSYVCHLDRASLSPNALSSSAPQSVFALPLDRKIPKIRFRTRQVGTLIEQKFLVSIDSWQPTSRHPEGHLVRALGKVETKEAEIESLLLEHDVPYRPFSKAILDCLPSEGSNWVVPPKSDSSKAWKGREDLRDLLICSIDPPGTLLIGLLAYSIHNQTNTFWLPGCQDIDDALHARRLPNGNIEAGVRELARPGLGMLEVLCR